MLVYLLIVVNFQSWLDPFIMISALPAALAGIAWFLFMTHTTLSVPALMGAIMCMGVATSNSILVVSFATEKMEARKRFRQRRAGGRLHAFSSGADDRSGDDHRHGANGSRAGGRWGTKRSTGRAVIGGLIFAQFRRCSLFRHFSACCKDHASHRAQSET